MALPGALRFDSSKTHHVNHGAFWLKDVLYAKFYWDAFVRPTETNATGYLISAGYGPYHDLLLGFTSGSTHCSVTGNIWDGSAIKSFNSPAVIPLGDWVHIAVAWDLEQILVYINGTCEGRTAYAAANRSTANNYDAVLYVGGSDHSNFGLDLKWVRGFEGVVPIPSFDQRAAYRPERYPRTYYNDGTNEYIASFAADYSVPCEAIADLSGGFPTGNTHAGTRMRSTDFGAFFNSVQGPLVTPTADLPQWVNATVTGPTVETSTIDIGSKVYDDFNRDASLFWKNNDDCVLGSTEGGTQGVLAWQGAAADYGISYGRAFYRGVGEGLTCYVSAGTGDVDVRMTRTGGCTVLARYIDANNHVYMTTLPMGDGTDYITVGKKVAGVDTVYNEGIGAANSSDSIMRLVVSGNTVTAYVNGVQRYTGGSALPSSNNVGFHCGSGYMSKIDTFEVY